MAQTLATGLRDQGASPRHREEEAPSLPPVWRCQQAVRILGPA